MLPDAAWTVPSVPVVFAPSGNLRSFRCEKSRLDGPSCVYSVASQVVEALCGVLVPDGFHTSQLDHQHVFDQDIGKVFPGAPALAGYCKRSLGDSPDAPKTEFCDRSALVDFLKESRAQGARDLKDGPDHALGERIE